MTQAKLAPVLVHLRRGKLALTGVGTAAFCALFFLMTAADLSHGTGLTFVGKLLGGTALLLLPLGIFTLGLAWTAPVALRMDVHGISGFYTAPATWDEIEDMGVQPMPKGASALGFRLKDPVGFRDRQTAFQRFIFWLNGATGRYHLSIGSAFVKDTDPDRLLAQALTLQAASSETPDGI